MTSHDELIAGHFTNRSSYWLAVYDPDDGRLSPYDRLVIQRRRDLVLAAIDSHFAGKTGQILDAGCGAGVFVRAIADRGHRVTGVDQADGMLHIARHTVLQSPYAANASLLKANVQSLEFKDDSFDAVLSVGVLEYVENLEGAATELLRVLRPNGLLVVTFPNLFKLGHVVDPYYYINRFPAYVLALLRRDKSQIRQVPQGDNVVGRNVGFLVRRFTRRRVERLFAAHGCRRVAHHNVGFGPLTFWRREMLRAAQTWRISHRLCDLSVKPGFWWLGALADRWVFVFRKAAR